ncbi:MAG: uridine kinase, partial [Dysosmobacter sp.]
MAYSLKTINESIRSDPAAFVAECEAAHAKKIQDAARRIAEHRSESHIVLLSGPSGSGKTTTALKIEEVLDNSGVETHTISMDNYFNTIDPDTAPRNREGNIDYESPFCLDIDLLNRHFSMLDRGETIHIPKYEFARQMRSDILSQPLKLGPDELAIFEGIHALNDVIIGKNPKAFKLYIAARSNVVDEDGTVVFQHAWLRLCRRIVRDYKFRGSDADFTLKMWPNVRRGEKLYISPYKENANLMFDSS